MTNADLTSLFKTAIVTKKNPHFIIINISRYRKYVYLWTNIHPYCHGIGVQIIHGIVFLKNRRTPNLFLIDLSISMEKHFIIKIHIRFPF